MRPWIVLVILLSFSTAHAEANPKAMRITGAIFSAVAAGLGVVSFSFFAAREYCTLSDCVPAYLFAGGIFAASAVAAAGVGVPLLAVGEHRLEQRARVAVAVVPAISAREAALNFRMTW